MLVVPAQGGDFVPVASGLRALPRGSALAKRLSLQAGRSTSTSRDPARRFATSPPRTASGSATPAPRSSSRSSARADELDGVLALGPKRSELPYSRQDRTLLELVAGAAGIGLENRRLKGSDSGRSAPRTDSAASECRACRTVRHRASSAARRAAMHSAPRRSRRALRQVPPRAPDRRGRNGRRLRRDGPRPRAPRRAEDAPANEPRGRGAPAPRVARDGGGDAPEPGAHPRRRDLAGDARPRARVPRGRHARGAPRRRTAAASRGLRAVLAAWRACSSACTRPASSTAT